MARGNESDVARRLRGAWSAGLLPLAGAIVSAAALTGAAFYTVDQATCGDPAQYIRHDDHVELVGGCVKGSHLPKADLPAAPTGATGHGNYGP